MLYVLLSHNFAKLHLLPIINPFCFITSVGSLNPSCFQETAKLLRPSIFRLFTFSFLSIHFSHQTNGIIEKTQLHRMAYIQNGRNAIKQIVKSNVLRNSDGSLHPVLYACHGVRFRKLEVILTTSIDKLGKAGETVKVAPGYFRNHLMPKLLAVPNIEKYAYLVREQRKIYQPTEVEEVKVVTETVENKMKEYETAAKRLDNARLVLRRSINVEKLRTRATKDEPIELQSPVTKEELLSEVARQLCVKIEPQNLHLPSPLTNVGEYEVPLRLPKSIPLLEGRVQWTLKVKVRCK